MADKSVIKKDAERRVSQVLSKHQRHIDSALGGYAAIPSSRYNEIHHELTSLVMELSAEERYGNMMDSFATDPTKKYVIVTDLSMDELSAMVSYGGIPPNVVGIVNHPELSVVEAESMVLALQESIRLAKINGRPNIHVATSPSKSIRPRI